MVTFPSHLRIFLLILLATVPVFGLSQGTHAWRVNAYPTGGVQIKSLDADASGNAYVIGTPNDFPGDVLVKLAPDGTRQWTFKESYLSLNVVKVGPDGSIYVGGNSSTNGFYAFLKLSPSDGSIIWRNVGSVFNAGVQSLAVGPDGSSGIVVGAISNGSTTYSYHFIKPDGIERNSITPPSLYSPHGRVKIDARGMFYDGGAITPNDGYLFRANDASSHLFTFPSAPISAFDPDNLGFCYIAMVGLKKTSDDLVVWTVTQPDANFIDVASTVSGKAIVAGFNSHDNTALISRFRGDGVLELSNVYAGLQHYNRVLCDPNSNAYTLTQVLVNSGSYDVYLRKLSAFAFSTMWVGNSPGGSEKVNYSREDTGHFVRSASGDLFTAGMGPSGQLYVDKFSDRGLASFTIAPNPVQGSRNALGRITLTGPAVADAPVSFNMPPHVIIPNPVTIPTGQTTKSFVIWATDPTTPFVNSSVTATVLGDSKTVVLKVLQGNSAKFVGCTLPAAMVGGTTFHVKMRFINTGTLTWDVAHHYELRSTNPVDNLRWHVNRMELTNGPVAHGSVGVFSATVRAPLLSGTYLFKWEPIAGDAHGPFGAGGGPSVVVTSPLHPVTPPVVTRRRHRRGY